MAIKELKVILQNKTRKEVFISLSAKISRVFN